MCSVPVVIPCYEPDERLTELLKELCRAGIRPIVLVNDGSSPEYDACFEEAFRIIRPSGGILLSHAVNQGKKAWRSTLKRRISGRWIPRASC